MDQVRMGKGAWSRTYYTLRKDCHLFRNVSVQEPRHNSDHYFILGFLGSTTLREHVNYLGWCTQILLCPLTTLTIEDGLFGALHWALSKPKAREARNNAWILSYMWNIIGSRVSVRQDPALDQGLLRRIGRQIEASLKVDRRRRAETYSVEIEALLTSGSPPQQGILVQNEGDVKGRVLLCAAACST